MIHLHIAPNRVVGDIQKEFNQLFPFLKLEFFSTHSFSKVSFSSSQMLEGSQKIGSSQLAITDGYIDITPSMKVEELETIFKKDYSLAVQVFRKSGNIWLPISLTNTWTLQQQNYHGEEISTS